MLLRRSFIWQRIVSLLRSGFVNVHFTDALPLNSNSAAVCKWRACSLIYAPPYFILQLLFLSKNCTPPKFSAVYRTVEIRKRIPYTDKCWKGKSLTPKFALIAIQSIGASYIRQNRYELYSHLVRLVRAGFDPRVAGCVGIRLMGLSYICVDVTCNVRVNQRARVAPWQGWQGSGALIDD